MATRFGIVEIGSTNAKAYTCVKGEILSKGFHNMEFAQCFGISVRSSLSDALEHKSRNIIFPARMPVKAADHAAVHDTLCSAFLRSLTVLDPVQNMMVVSSRLI